MPKFHVKDTFELSGRKLFVLAGSIVEGTIAADMFVHVPYWETHGLRLRVDCIEFARRSGGEDVCLCIDAGPELSKILSTMAIAGKTYEVKAIGPDD